MKNLVLTFMNLKHGSEMADPRFKKDKTKEIKIYSSCLTRNLELRYGYLIYRQIALIRLTHKSNNLYSGLYIDVLKKKYRTEESCLQANLQRVKVYNDTYCESYVPIEFNYEDNGAITIKRFLK